MTDVVLVNKICDKDALLNNKIKMMLLFQRQNLWQVKGIKEHQI